MFRTTLFAASLFAATACSPGSEAELEPDLGMGDKSEAELSEHVSSSLVDTDATLVVTEVMRNPDAVSDRNGEWIEIFNQSLDDIDLNGLEVRDSRGTGFVVDQRVRVPPFGFAVLARSTDPDVNGGIDIVDFAWDGSFSLANAGDDIELVYEGVVEDVVVFDRAATAGVSEQLSRSWHGALVNDDPSHWCSPAEAYGDGDLGTPGANNIDCGDTVMDVYELFGGELVITEIMRNPDATTDARGEWFEIHNTTDAIIDLEHVTIMDSAGHSFDLPAGLAIEQHGYLVLGQSTDSTINGGAPVDFAWPGTLTLGNGADDLIIDSFGDVIDQVSWDSSWHAPVGASLILHDTIDPFFDNDEAGSWCVATDAYGHGDRGTPGQPGGC